LVECYEIFFSLLSLHPTQIQIFSLFSHDIIMFFRHVRDNVSLPYKKKRKDIMQQNDTFSPACKSRHSWTEVCTVFCPNVNARENHLKINIWLMVESWDMSNKMVGVLWFSLRWKMSVLVFWVATSCKRVHV
jgi:hypothetical protein